jgi:DNA-binding response OmpR family regulator
MRVLIVEDERELADAIVLGLRHEGYAVDPAYTGIDGFIKARAYPYDVVCLDVNLPGMDGREICSRLRAPGGDGGPRILMLTAQDALEDRVAGLDAGADDYLVKPFQFDELAARIRALLRRDAGQSGAVLRVGGLELDAARHVSRSGGTRLELTPKEFALLRYFMTRPGEVLSEGHLLEHVWDENADPATRTVRVTVGNLRRKLLAAGTRPIETVPGRGYRLCEDGGERG